ncbi:MAG: HAD-IC family P-type ATPase, partial [Anaerolineales bacterium]|nr:HAD-IC family P-type ATPase [Anaerolineales bacterium]
MEENKTASKRSALIWASIILAALAALAAVLVKYWRVRQAHLLTQERKPAPPPQPIHAEIQGLTAAEADARRGEAQDNLIQLQPRRTTKEILRYNTLSIFNLSLVGIAFVQLLLGQPLDALLSLGVMLLNIGLNTAQELIAKRRLRDLKTATQPSVTVIRDDAAQSIDPNEIVVGDALVAGPGDYLFVDGEVMGEGHLVMNESLLSTSSDTPTKREGDPVYAGSYCLSGRAVYITQKVGQDRKISKLLSELQTGKEELTPLESIINRILKVLLAIVAIFTFILLATYFRLDLGIPSEVIIDATSVIFSIAPASLFFMILLTYAGGTADLAKLGALVHRARSVESLAQIDTICFAREGVLTGTHVEIEDLQPPDGNSRVAESRLRQILGDYARSTSLDNFAVRAMANSFEGNRREILTEAPFLAVFGWSAVTFDHNDLRGLYVLGVPVIMETYLIAGSEETAEIEPDAQPKEPSSLKRMTTGIGKLFRRNKNEEPDEQTDSDNQAQPETDPTDQLEERGDPDTENTPEDESPKPNIFK